MFTDTQRGRIYVLIFIVSLAVFDLAVKGFLLSEGTLKWSQAVGTAITGISLWYLWRGSKFAHGFILVCLVLASLLTLAMASSVPMYFTAFLSVAIALAFLALLAPASRGFLANRRASRA